MKILDVGTATTHPAGHIPATFCGDNCLKKVHNFSSCKHKNTFNNQLYLTKFFKKATSTNIWLMLMVTAKNWPEKDETAGKYQQGSVEAAFCLNKYFFNEKKQSFLSSLTCRITESGAVTKMMSSCWGTDKLQQKTRMNSAPHTNL